jgi:Ni,Fe-hydrogenase III small subunit
MFESDDFSIDCKTCIGAGTTACTDCIVTHLFANDDGPIDYVPVQLTVVPAIPNPEDVAIEMLQSVGLIGATAEFVPVDEFRSYAIPVAVRV